VLPTAITVAFERNHYGPPPGPPHFAWAALNAGEGGSSPLAGLIRIETPPPWNTGSGKFVSPWERMQELLASRPAGLGSVRIDATLEPAPVQGDRALLERMIANLLDNAVAHNRPRDGWASVWTGSRDGRPTLAIGNSGPVIPPGAAKTLLDPFRRLNGERTDHGRGFGLGLSIVNAIAGAHGAELRAVPRVRGGLEIEISFPPAHRPAAS
jgi:signal transduction histidine kinase